MKLRELCSFLESEIPLAFQESYDNSGLQVGNPEMAINAALLAVDVTEEVIAEALKYSCNLVISHHPLIFGNLKRITGNTQAERIVYSCIKNDIAVYSAHTNLDITHSGVSRKMAEKLGLENIVVLVPLEKKLIKLVTYIPESHLDKVRNAIFDAGAGSVGNYDRCGFTVDGTGSFRGNEQTNPFVGKSGEMTFEKEVRFETVFYSHLKEKMIRTLIENHPYEEVAYDLYSLENRNIDAGLGCTGEFPSPLMEEEFLHKVSEVFNSGGIRHSQKSGRKINKVALCGGSGASLISNAISSKSDAYITADIKYHSYFEAENKLLLVDTGHYESEKFAVEILKDLIIKKFPKFALRFSETNTNPINYL
jgi:dinuclear metal center YbgI/SA1388 family protein